jgi:RNA polymerase sigma-70 factor (ECF subfamily)
MTQAQANPGDWTTREALLVSRIREHGTGDREAWGELLGHHQDRLYSVCLRMVGKEHAADLTQDAMVKVLQGLEGYDGRSQLSTWMIRIAMNTCLSWLRGQKLRRHKGLGTEEESVRSVGTQGGSGELSPDGGVQRDERHAAVGAALLNLPEDQRAILILRDVQGLDYEQVAAVLEVAVGTVKSRLFRARLALRELVEERLGTRMHSRP